MIARAVTAVTMLILAASAYAKDNDPNHRLGAAWPDARSSTPDWPVRGERTPCGSAGEYTWSSTRRADLEQNIAERLPIWHAPVATLGYTWSN